MKARLAAVALLVAAGAASAALNAYRTGISLPRSVKLADGSVLPAGKYDVQIDYKGFGNAAEFLFFQGGAPKGKTPAEARGFTSQPPTAPAKDGFAKIGDIKGETDSTEVKLKKVVGPGDEAVVKSSKVDVRGEKWASSADPAGFSWGKAGFPEGRKGVVTKGPPGMLKLSFDSVNSAAGFSAILPYMEKRVENPTTKR